MNGYRDLNRGPSGSVCWGRAECRTTERESKDILAKPKKQLLQGRNYSSIFTFKIYACFFTTFAPEKEIEDIVENPLHCSM
jgi:hypothetical protein